MKIFKVSCDVFKCEILFISNCSYDELRLHLKAKYRCTIEERGAEDGTIGTMLTFEKHPWRVVWTKEWKDKSCLIHELFHLVTRICYDRGIKIVSHNEDGSNGDEAAAYLMEFFTEQTLRRK